MDEPTFWQTVWTWFKRLSRWIYAPILALALVLGGVLLVSLGFKEVRIGGILGRLLGKSPKKINGILLKNTVEEDRVDDAGKPIPVETPDERGYRQVYQDAEIQDPGLFSDPDEIVVKEPTTGDKVHVRLPEGVTHDDVDSVVVVSPEVAVVTVKSDSPVTVHDINSVLDHLEEE